MSTNRSILSKWLNHRAAGVAAPAAGPPAQPETAVPQGCVAMGCFEPDDIFVIGYPKSGNTWVQCLLAGAVFGLDLELAPQSLVRDLVPSMHAVPFFKRYSSPVFFKSHALPAPEFRRVIYLLRDGRDAMVSYYHFLQATLKRDLDFLATVQTGEHFFPCKWHEHVRQWLEVNPHGSRILTVRYEDLKRDPVDGLRRMCEFAGLERDQRALEAAAGKASFASMRKREERLGWSGDWPKDKRFVRRGVAGSYVDEMPLAVQQAFWREAGPTLIKLGYATPADAPAEQPLPVVP